MKKLFIFCHGWASTAYFWKNLQPLFFINNQANSIYLNLGYFSNSKDNLDILNNFFNNDSKYNTNNYDQLIDIIGVGHSFGLIKLLLLGEKFNIRFKALIGLNSFVNFLGDNNSLSRQRQLELRALQQNFNFDPALTLKNFYQVTGLDLTNDNIKYHKLNTYNLTKDLGLLAYNYQNYITENTKLLIIGAKDDVIISEDLILDNFIKYKQVTVEILTRGGHTLGYLMPRLIYNKITNFICQI